MVTLSPVGSGANWAMASQSIDYVYPDICILDVLGAKGCHSVNPRCNLLAYIQRCHFDEDKIPMYFDQCSPEGFGIGAFCHDPLIVPGDAVLNDGQQLIWGAIWAMTFGYLDNPTLLWVVTKEPVIFGVAGCGSSNGSIVLVSDDNICCDGEFWDTLSIWDNSVDTSVAGNWCFQDVDDVTQPILAVVRVVTLTFVALPCKQHHPCRVLDFSSRISGGAMTNSAQTEDADAIAGALTSLALVYLMTAWFGFSCGILVRVVSMAIVTLIWVVFRFAWAFGEYGQSLATLVYCLFDEQGRRSIMTLATHPLFLGIDIVPLLTLSLCMPYLCLYLSQWKWTGPVSYSGIFWCPLCRAIVTAILAGCHKGCLLFHL